MICIFPECLCIFVAALPRQPGAQREEGREALLRGAGGLQQEEPDALPLSPLRCCHQGAEVKLRDLFELCYLFG